MLVMVLLRSIVVALIIAFTGVTTATLSFFQVPIVKNLDKPAFDAALHSATTAQSQQQNSDTPGGQGLPLSGQLADCQSGEVIIDLQGDPTLATKTATYLYAHAMDGGPATNNECGTYTLYGADPKTFVALDQFYATDSKGVWFIADPSEEGAPNSYQIVGADAATFTLIPDIFFPPHSVEEGFSEFYTKDKNHVYWLGQVVPDADPA